MTLALIHSVHAAAFDKGFYETIAGIIPVLFITIAVEGRLIQGLLDASTWVLNLAAWIAKPLYALAVVWPSVRDAIPEITTRDSRRGAQQQDGHPPGRMARWIWTPFVLAVVTWLLLFRSPRKHPRPAGARDGTPPQQAAVDKRLLRKVTQAANVVASVLVCAAVLLAAGVAAVGLVTEAVVVLALYHEHAADWTGPFVVSATIVLIGAVGVTPAVALIGMAAKAARSLTEREEAPEGAAAPEVRPAAPEPGADEAGILPPADVPPGETAPS